MESKETDSLYKVLSSGFHIPGYSADVIDFPSSGTDESSSSDSENDELCHQNFQEDHDLYKVLSSGFHIPGYSADVIDFPSSGSDEDSSSDSENEEQGQNLLKDLAQSDPKNDEQSHDLYKVLSSGFHIPGYSADVIDFPSSGTDEYFSSNAENEELGQDLHKDINLSDSEHGEQSYDLYKVLSSGFHIPGYSADVIDFPSSGSDGSSPSNSDSEVQIQSSFSNSITELHNPDEEIEIYKQSSIADAGYVFPDTSWQDSSKTKIPPIPVRGADFGDISSMELGYEVASSASSRGEKYQQGSWRVFTDADSLKTELLETDADDDGISQLESLRTESDLTEDQDKPPLALFDVIPLPRILQLERPRKTAVAFKAWKTAHVFKTKKKAQAAKSIKSSTGVPILDAGAVFPSISQLVLRVTEIALMFPVKILDNTVFKSPKDMQNQMEHERRKKTRQGYSSMYEEVDDTASWLQSQKIELDYLSPVPMIKSIGEELECTKHVELKDRKTKLDFDSMDEEMKSVNAWRPPLHTLLESEQVISIPSTQTSESSYSAKVKPKTVIEGGEELPIKPDLQRYKGKGQGLPQRFGILLGVGVSVDEKVVSCDRYKNCLYVFSPEGHYITSHLLPGARDVAGTPDGGMVAVNNHTLYKLDDQGHELWNVKISHLQKSKYKGLDDYISGVCVDSQGLIYTRLTDSVSVVDHDGHVLRHIEGNVPVACWHFCGIAVQPWGDLLLPDPDNNCIVVLTGSGQHKTTLGGPHPETGGLRHPLGIAVDSTGNVAVPSLDGDTVSVYSPTGECISTWGGEGKAPGKFSHPTGITFTPSGDIIICDKENKRIQIFQSPTSQKAHQRQATPEQHLATDHPPHYSSPPLKGETLDDIKIKLVISQRSGMLFGVSVLRDDKVVACDWLNDCLYVFSPEGHYITSHHLPDARDVAGTPDGGMVAVNDYTLYKLDKQGHELWNVEKSQLQKYKMHYILGVCVDSQGLIYTRLGHSVCVVDSEGQVLRHIEHKVPHSDSTCCGIAVQPWGNILLPDPHNNCVVVLSESGQHKTMGSDPEKGGLSYPCGIAVDSTGNVAVTSWLGHTVSVYSPTGEFISTWGGMGKEPGKFSFPTGIAFTPSGDIIICDRGNERIQIFQSPASQKAHQRQTPCEQLLATDYPPKLQFHRLLTR